MEERIIITHDFPKSPIAEAYRTLRTNLQFSNIDKNIQTIVITSSGPGEGKSTVAVNLAAIMVQVDKKVLVIDSDLRKPKVHTFFDVENTYGLTTALAEDFKYEQLIRKTEIKNLDILTSGPIPPNPSELLGSKKMKIFLKQLKDKYDIIILDSPPVALVTDAAVLSTITDGTLLVCAVGQAVVEGAKNAKALLEKVKANILGVILNKIPVNEGGYYKYHYYSYNQGYYQEEAAATKKRARG